VLFEHAYTPASLTRVTLPLLFTGFCYSSFPVPLEVKYLPDELVTLAEVFREAGFITIAVTESMTPFRRNYNSGFDYVFHHRFSTKKAKDRLGILRKVRVSDPKVFTKFQKILKLDKKRPVFLYIHMIDPHWHFEPSIAIVNQFLVEGDEKRVKTKDMFSVSDTENVEYFRRLYQGAVLQADTYLSRYLSQADKIPRLRDAYLMLTADHGELLYENRMWVHNKNTDHDGLIKIPYIWVDGEKTIGKRRSYPVSLIDTLPTVLSLYDFKIKSPIPMDGVALFSRNLEKSLLQERFIINDYPIVHSVVLQNGRKISLKKTPLSAEDESMLTEQIRNKIAQLLDERKRKRTEILKIGESPLGKKSLKKGHEILDPHILDQLKSLGYIK
jgi:arylsulfatase A-like enzyme